ncbi:sigma-54-dependent transcriptional regulator [Thermodesulfobacteriota bacterium B35]
MEREEKAKILIVDDTVDTVELLTKRLRAEGYDTEAAMDGEEALRKVRDYGPDLVILDVMMPKLNGYEVCRRLKEFPDRKFFRILMLTAKSKVSDKVRGLDIGADSYLTKPFDYRELSAMVRNLLQQIRSYTAGRAAQEEAAPGSSPHLSEETGKIGSEVITAADIGTERLRRLIREKYTFHRIISRNGQIHRILRLLPSIARSESTVLIEGPSGSGKELFARAIHELSGRTGAFVALNCAALPDTLLESELFGYRKGAFTGAVRDKEGRFALARSGTIFLDEIGDVSPALQLKLLRVLQEHEFEPLGGTSTVRADVRVIAATNRNLKEAMEKGTFRADLYFRLNVIHIGLPPLVRRREDIPLLIQHFLDRFNQLKKKQLSSVSPAVFDLLLRYDYPGNIRELENIMEHCFALCQGDIIDVDSLPDGLTGDLPATGPPAGTAGSSATDPLADAEAATILAALQRFDGNRGKTAGHLGIDKTTLWRKMKKYHIEYPVKKR